MLGSQLYQRLIAANEILEPTKSAGYWGTMPTSLKDTRPCLRGTWVFKDPNVMKLNLGRPRPVQQPLQTTAATSDPSSLFVVQIDWTDDGEDSYDKTETRFYKLDPGRNGPRAHMDINLLELGE